MKRKLAAVVLLLALGACGDGGSERPTVAGLAERLNKAGIPCQNLEMNNDVLVAREEGSCDSAGERVTIDVFNNNEARDAAQKLAESFGAKLALGDRWSISVDTDATAERVQKALGGKVA